MTDNRSLMTFALLSPTGHTRILAEQPGGGVAQLKLAPGGVEVNVILVEVPEQIEFVKGGLSVGVGLMVTGNDEVGPGFMQFAFVPNTVILPDVAVAAKFTVINASLGLIWVMIAPVPV